MKIYKNRIEFSTDEIIDCLKLLRLSTSDPDKDLKVVNYAIFAINNLDIVKISRKQKIIMLDTISRLRKKENYLTNEDKIYLPDAYFRQQVKLALSAQAMLIIRSCSETEGVPIKRLKRESIEKNRSSFGKTIMNIIR